MLKVVLGFVLLAAPALAASPPVTLSEAEGRVEGSASDAPTVAQPTAANRKASFFRLYGISAATILVVTPATMALAAWIGTWSSNLIAAIVPALVLLIAVPPIVTALVQWALGNALWGKGTFKIGWSILTGLLVQAALVVISVFVGVPGATVPGIAIFTAIDMVLLGGVSSGVMWATRIEPMATASTRTEREQGGSAGSIDLPRAPAAAVTTVRF